jgi:four helix bundle protein
MNYIDLQNRINQFALRLVPLCAALPNKKISRIIENQLLRSGFSAASNYRSACNALTKRSFNSKLSISLEEMDESSFWLEMIAQIGLLDVSKTSLIHQESVELTKILGASRRTALFRTN